MKPSIYQVSLQAYHKFWLQACRQVPDKVGRQVWRQVEGQVHDQVWNQVYNQVRNQVLIEAGKDIK